MVEDKNTPFWDPADKKFLPVPLFFCLKKDTGIVYF